MEGFFSRFVLTFTSAYRLHTAGRLGSDWAFRYLSSLIKELDDLGKTGKLKTTTKRYVASIQNAVDVFITRAEDARADATVCSHDSHALRTLKGWLSVIVLWTLPFSPPSSIVRQGGCLKLIARILKS